MKKHIYVFLSLCLPFLSAASHALELPETGLFEFKEVEDKDILYVHHKKGEGHISNTLIKLIQFYLLQESEDYQVVFPQLSIERYDIDGSYYAIGYEGEPEETGQVKTTQLKGGMFASYIYKGNYRDIGEGIGSAFREISKTGKYVPHEKEEVRLLYWNSIDDNYPKDLITEIQIRVKKLR